MKTMNKNKPSISMRIDMALAWVSYVIYMLLSLVAIGIFVPVLVEIVYGASIFEVKEAFLQLDAFWFAMPQTALLILTLIGVLVIRAAIAVNKKCCDDIWFIIGNDFDRRKNE